jgi:hypothetical protein
MISPPRNLNIDGVARLWVFVGTLVGLVCGALLLGVVPMERNIWRLAWLAVSGTLGGVLGYLLLLAQNPDARSPADVTRIPAESGERSDDSGVQYIAVMASASSSQLRPMRVRSHTAPMSPPDLELKLLIEEYDYNARVPVIEGVLEKLPFRDLLDRVAKEALLRVPRTVADPRLTLIAYRSEGPVTDDGRSPLGWTFYFVDGRVGLACTASSTRREISLIYQTAPSWYRPRSCEPRDPAQAISLVRAALPELDGRELYVRFNLPSDTFVYARAPFAIVDVDVDGGVVRNLETLRVRLANDAPRIEESFALDELQAWFRGEVPPPESGLARALVDPAFAEGLRTLDSRAMTRAAAAAFHAEGPDLVARIEENIELADDAAAMELVHLLGRLPTGLAGVALQRLAASARNPRIRSTADELVGARRSGRMGVSFDPIEALNFAEVRALMGKEPVLGVPLRSTYDVEGELLAPLREMGLQVTRLRRLAGESELVLGAYLRPETGDTEGLLTSTPLPVACHILHLVGSGATDIQRKLERAGLVYRPGDLRDDLMSRQPHRVHVAALYVAAMRMDRDEFVEPLIAVYARARTDRSLRRAILQALEPITTSPSLNFIRERAADATGDDRGVAAEILARIDTRRGLTLSDATRSERRTGPTAATPGVSA